MGLKVTSPEQASKVLSLFHGNLIDEDVENGLSIDGFITFDEMADIVDYLRQPADTERDLFERCWVDYQRKGSKKVAYERWKKLSSQDRQKIVKHIPFYIRSNERIYLKDFERYISNRTFESVVIDKSTGQVIYDQERESGLLGYAPTVGGSLNWNDYYGCYVYIGMFLETLADGYTNDNRPNGARIMLSNGRGYVVWNDSNKQWEKE